MKVKESAKVGIKPKVNKATRQQIMESALASFRIEGIDIPKQKALETLHKIEATLGR